MMTDYPDIKGSKVTTLPDNPDMDLHDYQMIQKYQLQFTKYFGPAHAYGVSRVVRKWEAANGRPGGRTYFLITARVKAPYQPVKGKSVQYTVEEEKVKIWRNNVKLYDFIEAN